MRAYVMKKDEEPCIWRQYNIDQFKEIALARNRGNQSSVLESLEGLEDWYQVYRDDLVYRDDSVKTKILTRGSKRFERMILHLPCRSVSFPNSIA